MINHLVFYNSEANLLKICKQIEETMWLASGFYYAQIKIMPFHPEIIFR